LAILFLFSPCLAVAQQAIFLVRHGETVAPKGTDAPSPIGSWPAASRAPR
jgi:hypothetical protein